MNSGLATRCWRRALMFPGVPDFSALQPGAPSDAAPVFGPSQQQVARGNLASTVASHEHKFAAYMRGSSRVRGGGDDGTVRPQSRACARPSSTTRLHLHVEGWRGIPHSFAVVARDLLRDLAARPGVAITFADAPMPDQFRGRGTRRGTAAEAEEDALPPSVTVLPFRAVGSTLPEGSVTLRLWCAESCSDVLPSLSFVCVLLVLLFGVSLISIFC